VPAANGSWRCFVAVPIGDELREALRTFTGRLRRDGAAADGWRWTDPDGWHMTLAFLGATDPARVPVVGRALTGVAGSARPFDLVTGGLGAFPSRGPRRVLWYGSADPDGRLHRLARACQSAAGLASVERFRAHLTLARARERFGADASAYLSAGDAPGGRLAVDRLVLYRSHTGQGPARYEELLVAPLTGGAP
jgi:2'-5' RNA ligase